MSKYHPTLHSSMKPAEMSPPFAYKSFLPDKETTFQNCGIYLRQQHFTEVANMHARHDGCVSVHNTWGSSGSGPAQTSNEFLLNQAAFFYIIIFIAAFALGS